MQLPLTAKRQDANIRHYATTSAALKLLLLFRTLRSPGRPDLVAETTTADALFFIHAFAIADSGRFSALTFGMPFVASRFASVGSREGGGGDGGGGGGCRRVAGTAATAAFAAPGVRVVASLGILLGPCCEPFTGDSVPDAPAFRMAAALAVDRVTRVGRDSDDVTLPATLDVLTFGRVIGAMPSAGRTSSVSSESESDATRFTCGVFRGWPGVAMALAFAVPLTTCLLGVTGGKETEVGRIDGGVVCMGSESSSVSAGGVAGVTTAGAVAVFASCVF